MRPEEASAAESAPGHIQELAAACEEYVKRSVGTALDGTPDTLPLLDHYLRQIGREEPGSLNLLVSSAAGAYFGEIVRRRFACRWAAPPDDPLQWRLEFSGIFLHFNPVAVAYEAIMRRESGLGATFEALDTDQSALHELFASLPRIRKDDFYTLATRLEVLERVVSELSLLAQSRGDRDDYTAEDYRAELDGDDS